MRPFAKNARGCGIFRVQPQPSSAKRAQMPGRGHGTASALSHYVYRVTLVAVSLALLIAATRAQERPTPSALREHPKIPYPPPRPADPVARLNDQLAAGQVTLARNDRHGYLESV